MTVFIDSTGRKGGARETNNLYTSWCLYLDSRSYLSVGDENKEVVSWGRSLIWVIAQIKYDVTEFPAYFTSIRRRVFSLYGFPHECFVSLSISCDWSIGLNLQKRINLYLRSIVKKLCTTDSPPTLSVFWLDSQFRLRFYKQMKT